MEGKSQPFGRLIDFVGMIIIIAASIAVLILASGGTPARERPVWAIPQFVWFAIALVYFAGILALRTAHWPSLTFRNENLILVKRRFFRNSNVEERIPINGIARVTSRPLSGRYSGERPMMIIELTDGRKFRISRSRMEDDAYAALTPMANQKEAGSA